MTTRKAEVARFKVASIFNPLHVLGNPISVPDIDSLKTFSLSEHPLRLIRPHIEGMKSELIKYHTLVKSFKPLDQKGCQGQRHVCAAVLRLVEVQLGRHSSLCICAARGADKRTQLVPA